MDMLNKLRGQRAELVTESKALFAEARELTAEEMTKDDEIQAKIEALNTQIERYERQAERERTAEMKTDILNKIESQEPETWRTTAEFLGAVFNAGRGIGIDPRLTGTNAAVQGMNVASPSEGGFAVPTRLEQRIWDDVMGDSAALLPMCDNYQNNGPIELLGNGETTRATGTVYGGTRAYWVEEGDQLQRSTPKLRKIACDPKQLAVLTYITEKLISQASPGFIENYATRSAAEAIQFAVNDAIINGSGAGKPLGILNSGSLITVAKEAGQPADTILTENVVKMFSRMLPKSRSRAIVLANADIEPQLATMSVGVGTGGALTYMPPGGLSVAPYGTLYGRPIVYTEHCSALGDVGDIIIADMKAYLAVVGSSLQSAMSMHLRFDYLENAYRWTFLMDGQPWLNSAMTPAKGLSKSTFVTLAAR